MLSQVLKSILICGLFLSATSLWADSSTDENQIDVDQTPDSSAMDSWQEGWQTDEKRDRSTWFGMGYESRRGSSGIHGATSPGNTNKGSGGNGPNGGGGRGR